MKKGDATNSIGVFREDMGYDAHGNVTSITRYGKKSSGIYGTMDNLTLSYDGNRLTGVSEAASDYDVEGSFEYKRAKGSQYIYDANGSLVADKSRGIVYITYDANNNPRRIYFANGNETRFVYSASGQKLRVTHNTAKPNITRTFGVEPAGLTTAQILYADSTDYLLGGSLVVRDGVVDKYLFEGGYARKSASSPASNNFVFLYYNQDHLGNIREVVHSRGSVHQVTNYYPFGAPYADAAAVNNANFQPYKYNGKELDRMHGLDTYDYGARQYDPILGRWDRMDPLCEKYYSVSPYAYCANNPVNAVDPDGKKVYLYATTLPGARPILKDATHTFLVVRNQEDEVLGYYAYGSEFKGMRGAFGGRLKQHLENQPDTYLQDIAVYKGIDKKHLKKVIEVTPPAGMTSEEFDQKVMDVANSFGNEEGITYFLNPLSNTTGNCNSSTSTILIKAGVSSEQINEIDKQIPGIHWGFSDKPKPWTSDEQKAAIESERIIKEMNSRSGAGPMHP